MVRIPWRVTVTRENPVSIIEPMPFPTNHVANTLLQRAFREGRSDMSPMKLQKMLFYTHGWHLATTGIPAIEDHFEVWQWGPVVGNLYHELKHFGASSVTEYLKDRSEDKPFVVNSYYKNLYESVDIAWEKYIGINATRLSAMTHEPGSPWDLARQESRTYIPNNLIQDYFVRLARQ